MKTFRGSIALLAILALLGAVVLFLDSREPSQPATVGREVPVYTLEAEQITAIAWQGSRSPVELTKDVTGKWLLAGDPEAPVDEWQVQSAVNHIAKLRAERVVAESIDNPADYGLDRPTGRLSFSLADGTTEVLIIGVRNPLGTSVYARRAGADNLYLLNASTVTTFEQLAAVERTPSAEPVSTPAFTPKPSS